MPSISEERRMEAFLQEFEASPNLPEERILNAILDWQNALGPICAAEALLAMIAPICVRRPELTLKLIEFPLRLLANFGYDSSEDEVLPWAWQINQDPFFPVEPSGRQWIGDTFPTLSPQIQEILDWIWRKELDPTNQRCL